MQKFNLNSIEDKVTQLKAFLKNVVPNCLVVVNRIRPKVGEFSLLILDPNGEDETKSGTRVSYLYKQNINDHLNLQTVH